MKYLKLFENFSNEIERAKSQLADLDALRDFAMLSADEYRQQSKDLYAMIALPINSYYNYTQSDVDLMSRYPEVEWTLEKDQFLCNANNTRNWNIRFKGPAMRSVSLEGSVESARDILAKLQRDGIRSLEFLIYPSDDINLTDYQLSVEHPHIVGQPL